MSRVLGDLKSVVIFIAATCINRWTVCLNTLWCFDVFFLSHFLLSIDTFRSFLDLAQELVLIQVLIYLLISLRLIASTACTPAITLTKVLDFALSIQPQ